MKRVVPILIMIILGAGCIDQFQERPELRINASADWHTLENRVILEIQVENTGKTDFHDVTVTVELPHGFASDITEYTVERIEPDEERVFHFDIQPLTGAEGEGEYTLIVHVESDELAVEREFTFQMSAVLDEEKIEERIFGAQYDPSDLYDTDVDTLIQQLKQAGINILVFRVFDYESEPLSECGVYFETDHAPVKKDLLKEVVEKAHRENIQVYAWMTTMDCPWILADHPEWGVVAYDWDSNEYITNASWWLRVSPFNSEHREYLTKLYADLARYDIEGIVFQDDLYLRDNEDFSSYAQEAYSRTFGKPLSIEPMYDEDGYPTPEGITWIEWKCDTLMDMCKEIMDAVHAVNPDCKFMIDLYYEVVYNPENCKKWYAQDAELAVQSGFDYLYVMSYHRFIAGDTGLSAEEAIDLLADMTRIGITLVGPEQLIMKVQVYDWFTEKPVEDWEIEKAYTVLIGAGCQHIAYTPHHDKIPFELIKKFAPKKNRFCYI